MDGRPPDLSAARARFAERGAVRVDGVLDYGLASELACYLPSLGPGPRHHAEHRDLSWACEFGVPEGCDPQHPACLYRLVRFLDQELPGLASAVAGRRLAPAFRRRVHLWAFRRGAYVDEGRPLAPAGGVDVLVGLTWARWPVEWGGHLVLDDLDPPLPLAAGAAFLLGDRGYRVSLVTRQVEALAVRTVLVPA